MIHVSAWNAKGPSENKLRGTFADVVFHYSFKIIGVLRTQELNKIIIKFVNFINNQPVPAEFKRY
ncbi:MAG: hypothetical protein H6Q68_825 [Firmicutes bacterium]|nr:hypothetical protein [Bacillota bacterium]